MCCPPGEYRHDKLGDGIGVNLSRLRHLGRSLGSVGGVLTYFLSGVESHNGGDSSVSEPNEDSLEVVICPNISENGVSSRGVL